MGARGPKKGCPRPEGAGRKKGTLNKRSQEVADILANLDYCPVTALVHFAKGDWEALGLPGPTKTISIGEGQTIEVDRIDEQLRQKSAKDLMPYAFPQLKGIEFKGDTKDKFNSFAEAVAAVVQQHEEKRKQSDS